MRHSLRLLNCSIGRDLFRIPALFPHLTTVGLTLKREDEIVDVTSLAQLPKLQHLAIFGEVMADSGQAVTIRGLLALTHLTALTSLCVSSAVMYPDSIGLTPLFQLPQLQELAVAGSRQVTPTSVARLTALSNL